MLFTFAFNSLNSIELLKQVTKYLNYFSYIITNILN